MDTMNFICQVKLYKKFKNIKSEYEENAAINTALS